MNWFLPALASALIFGLSGFMMKYGSARGASSAHLLCGLYVSGTAGFFILALTQDQLDLNPALLVSGLIVGIGSTFGNYFFMRSLSFGPASLTAPIVNANVVFIVLMSVFYYGETITVLEIVGITLLLICICILPIDPQESISVHHKIWYLFVSLATVLFFLRNGGLKITEEMALNNTLVLFYGYLFGLLWSIGQMAWERQKTRTPSGAGPRRTGWISGLIAGLFSFSGMQIYAYALTVGPASLVSPIFSVYGLVIALLSMWWFSERLSIIQILSLIGIMTGIVLLRI